MMNRNTPRSLALVVIVALSLCGVSTITHSSNGQQYESKYLEMYASSSIEGIVITDSGNTQDPRIVVEEAIGQEDSVNYRIRRGDEVRNLVLHQSNKMRIIVVYNDRKEILALAGQVDGSLNSRMKKTPQVLVTHYTKEEGAAPDSLTQAVIAREFIASLSLPDRSRGVRWKKGFGFLNSSNKPIRLVVTTFPSYDQLFMKKIKDIWCKPACANSYCAVCRAAMCDWYECIHSAGGGNCTAEAQKVNAYCYGIG